MERNVTPTSRLAGMEDAAQMALDENARIKSLEDIMNSQETSAMNDRAEFEIYGDKGRTTYTYTEEYVDPVDGVRKEREVSTADKPYAGKLESIKSDRRYGKTESDRKDASDKYLEDINKLVEDGFELTQAKLIMDLRESDKDGLAALAGKFIGEGENPLVAKKRAKDLYAKKDKKRNDLIYDKGLRNSDEYGQYLSNGDVDRSAATGRTPETPDAPREISPDQQEAIDSANAALAEARAAYVDVSSRRRKLSFGLRSSKRESAVEEARDAYNAALTHAGEVVRGAFDTTEMSQEDLLNSAKLGWALESEALNVDGLTHRQEELADGRFMGRFNDWWTRQTAVREDGSRPRFGRLKKIAVMGALGIGTGLAAGAVLTGVGVGLSGAALPALLAYRFTKGQAVGRISRNAESATQAEVHNSQVHAENLARIEAADSLMTAETLTELSHDKTGEYVRRNRIRLAGSAALGATVGLIANTEVVKGAVGSLVDRIPGVGDGGNGGSAPDTTPAPQIPTGQTGPALGPELPGSNPVLDPSDITPVEEVIPEIGSTFNVESGNGFVSEIQDFAQSQGIELDGSKAYSIYEEGLARFGQNGLITGDTYQMSGGGIGISAPGETSWNPAFQQFLEESLKNAAE